MPEAPYCGSPPAPGGLAWNADPVLIAALAAIAVLYAIGCRGAAAPSRREQAFFAAGLAILAAALISPLCNLSVALFSARVGQHIVLTLVAAPLIVFGRPERILSQLAPGLGRLTAPAGFWQAALAGALFAAAMWIWHSPKPYAATFVSDLVYWVMHLTTIGSALLLWRVLLDGRAIGSAAFAGVITAGQMALLGALLTLAPRALFDVHALTTISWGLSPLEDQQLGGLLMWIPGGLLLTAYALGAFGLWLKRLDGSAPVRS